MGVLVSNKLLIKKSLIILSGLFSAIGIILNSVAMGTNYWITSSGCQADAGTCAKDTHLSVNYGLFSGLKALDSGLSPNNYPLTVFCPADEQGLCLLSCGRNVDEQKEEFDLVRNYGKTFNCTSSTNKNSKSFSEASSIQVKSNVQRNLPSRDSFLLFGFWLATVIFLSLTIAFQVLATGLCVLNSFPEVPVEVWLGPMGIYIANGATSLTSLITLAIWGALYSTHLSNEIAIQETILDTWLTDSTNLGYSYWLIFVSLLLTIASTILIRFRNVPQKHVTDKEGATEVGATPGVILLY